MRLHKITSKGLVVVREVLSEQAFSASVVITTKLNLTLLQKVRSAKSMNKQVSYLADLKAQRMLKRIDRIALKYKAMLDSLA